MIKFYLQIADKKLTTTVLPLLFRDARAWVVLLTQWSEPRALVEKMEHLRYPMIFVAARWSVYLKLLFQSYKYQ